MYTAIFPYLQTNIHVFIQTCKISSISQNGIFQLSTVGKSRSFPFSLFPLCSAPPNFLFWASTTTTHVLFLPSSSPHVITYFPLNDCLIGNLFCSSCMQYGEGERVRPKISTQNISVFQPRYKIFGSKYKTKA